MKKKINSIAPIAKPPFAIMLHRYTGSYVSVQTGATSLFYGSFPNITFPVYTLIPTPGPTAGGPNLISSLTKLFQ